MALVTKPIKKAQFIPQGTHVEHGYVCANLPVYLVSAANIREAWQKKASRTQDHRAMASFQLKRPLHSARLTNELYNPVLDVPGVQVILTRVAPRKLDDDNLAYAFKAIRDGVADALGCKDNDPRVVWTYRQLARESAYGILIEVGMLERLPSDSGKRGTT